jgi:hypothetical protein
LELRAAARGGEGPATGFRLYGRDASRVVNRIARATSRPALKAIFVGALVILLTAAITWAGLRGSLRFGRLSIPPTYDDVVYFVSAAKFLSAWPSRWLAASLHSLLGAHAPFSTVMAAVGFLLTPGSYLGAYTVNALVIAGFLSGIAALVWRAPLADIVICLAGAACFPVMVQAVNEARPDLPWGLASGLAIGVLVSKPILSRSLPAIAILGFCCGLAALIKPSALPATLPCFAAAFLISAAADWFGSSNSPSVKPAVGRAVIFGLAAILPLVPYLSVSFSDIADYIWHSLVVDRAMWSIDVGLYGHAIYYSFGPVGQLALHNGLLVGLGLFAIRLALGAYLKSGDVARAVALLSALVACYVIPSITPVKSYFLGAMFYGPFVVSTALNYAAIVTLVRDGSGGRNLGPIWVFDALQLAVMMALAAVFLRAVTVSEPPLATVFDEVTRQEVRASSEVVWQVLRSLPVPAGRQLLVSVSSPFPVNASLLELYALQARIPLTSREDYFYSRLDDALRNITGADVMVVTSSLPHNLPTPRMGDEIIRALDGRGDLCVLQTVALRNDGMLRIYRKADPGGSAPPAR